jgi:4-methyl-5(b-hydroxyethyl)-thiazole monophosphate biosynthesis
MRNSQMTKKVLLLLADGFEPLEAAGFTDVFGWAAIDGKEPVELVSAGFRPLLRATFGFSVMPKAQISELDLNAFDALAIPGGFAAAGFYDEALSEPFLDVIRSFAARDRDIASVCVASLALGAAGALNGRRATTYHQVGGKRKDQLEQYGALFVDQAVVEDGRMISSTGPGTAIEVALRLLANLTSPENAAHIRGKMRVPELDQSWLHRPQV